MFKVGDMAVYPAHGVGVVKGIECKEIAGNRMTFFILKILDNDMTIMIPKDNVESVGLRKIIPSENVPKVYEILKEKDMEVDHQTWNRRYREYMEKIKTGSLYEVAAVLRDLFLLKTGKDLSFGERKMLDMARNLLIKELSIAKNIEEEKVEKEVMRIFRRQMNAARNEMEKKRARV